MNYDYTRKDGTEVMITYRVISWGGGEYWGGEPFTIEVDAAYGLPDGDELSEEEWEEIELAIYANPPEPDLD